MEKIVIMSNVGIAKSPLAKNIQMLFPECKVQVVPNKKNGSQKKYEIEKKKRACDQGV